MVLTAHRPKAPTSTSSRTSWKGLWWALGWASSGAGLISLLSPSQHLGAVPGSLYALGSQLFLVGCLLATCRALDLPISRTAADAVGPQRRLWSVMALSALMTVVVCALVQVVGLDLTEDRVVAAVVVGLGVALSRCLGVSQATPSEEGLEGNALRRLLLEALRSAWRIVLLWLRMAAVTVVYVQVWSLTVLPVAAFLRPWWYDRTDTLRLLGALPASAPALVLSLLLVTMAHRKVRVVVRDRIGGRGAAGRSAGVGPKIG